MPVFAHVAIAGLGEVGGSLYTVYQQLCPSITLLRWDPFLGYKEASESSNLLLHIAIPFKEYTTFEAAVRAVLQQFPGCVAVVIHSSVAVDTTRKLEQQLLIPCFHSPVRGVHPQLAHGLKTFEKYFGVVDLDHDMADTVCTHFQEDLQIRVFRCQSEESELAKLLSTTYYGLLIAFHHDVYRLCRTRNLSFFNVMTHWSETYNQGYERLNKPHVRRASLQPIPEPDEKIGGHCVIPNCHLLLGHAELRDAANFVLRYS